MANTWADQVKPDDYVNIGDVGEGIVTTIRVDEEPPVGAWLRVLTVHVADDGFTEYRTIDERGRPYNVELPSAERVTVRQA